jgi:uncharacterized membrane protein YdbT with pleckstrin-like domain
VADFKLQTDEQLIKKMYPHWAIFSPALYILIFSLIFFSLGKLHTFGFFFDLLLPVHGFFSILFLILAVFIGLRQGWLWKTTYYVLTNKRLISCQGLLLKRHQSIKLVGIESVRINETLAGRYFNYGHIVIKSFGNSYMELSFIQEPMTLHDQLLNQ